MEPWEILLQILIRARRWPLPGEQVVRDQIAMWSALRESNEAVLRRVMGWKRGRDLIIDNLPEKVASAYGDLLFGEDPEWTPADENDADALGEMVGSWAEELPAAEDTCVSEGETWWRLSLPYGFTAPALTWHSRADVVPLLHGRHVRAVAFVSKLNQPGAQGGQVYRHLEIHGVGIVVNRLFVGRENALGAEIPLARHSATADLADEWRHGLSVLLAGRVPHRWGRRPNAGVSIYHGVWPRMLALNEAVTIGRENLRLTAKKRAVVPASALRTRPSTGDLADRGDGVMVPRVAVPEWDAGEDVLAHDPLDEDEGRNSAPFKVLEYSFDAAALIEWITNEVETIALRCDLVPQYLGAGDFGLSGNSGIALRVRLLPTVNAAQRRGRAWDRTLPVITQAGQLLANLSVAEGGAGNEAFANPGALPVVKRTHPLPTDETEVATRHATLKTADLISTEQSIRERYPKWDKDQVDAEVARIAADAEATLPRMTFPGGGGGE